MLASGSNCCLELKNSNPGLFLPFRTFRVTQSELPCAADSLEHIFAHSWNNAAAGGNLVRKTNTVDWQLTTIIISALKQPAKTVYDVGDRLFRSLETGEEGPEGVRQAGIDYELRANFILSSDEPFVQQRLIPQRVHACMPSLVSVILRH